MLSFRRVAAASALFLSVAWPASADPFRWEVPDVVDRTDVAGPVRVDGVPVDLQVVVTRWSIEKLVQHFADRFSDAGFYMAPRQKSMVRQPILTAFDPKTRTTYSVIFDAGPKPYTTVVLGVARWGAQMAARQSDFAPLFPGAESVVRTEDEGARMLAFRTRATADEVRDFYGRVLPTVGFRAVEPGVFQREGEQISVSAEKLPDGSTHVLLYARTVLPEPRAGDVMSQPR